MKGQRAPGGSVYRGCPFRHLASERQGDRPRWRLRGQDSVSIDGLLVEKGKRGMNEGYDTPKEDVRSRLDKLEAILETGIETAAKICGDRPYPDAVTKESSDDVLSVIESRLSLIITKASLLTERMHEIADRL